MHIKNTLRSLAEANGLEVQKTSVYSSQKLRHSKLFSLLGIDLLVDVGANAGQFATLCRAHGYRGSILSFEPSSWAHRELLKTAAYDPLWTVANRMALGAATGEAEINIAANSFSSSILPMLDSHLSAAPESQYIQRELVPVRRLDDVLPEDAESCKIFLKLDVQGYEPQVLSGAAHTLTQTSAVQLEMSLLPLYEGEQLLPQMSAAMKARGFDLWDLEPSFRDTNTGRLLQVDGIFTRQPVEL
ncbi:FkbM family methyltransferase [Tunturiibacter lichenicola]|uniref:FkbM family methyltransferase n=1 Tax=Tunturiibacter lichenicola TaxID=2051959 RepID=UPI003D9B8155